MLGRDYQGQNCSIAGTLEIVGERWSLLIIRDVLLGVRRFDELQANLGVARNVLQTRLAKLIDAGILCRRPYQERPVRHEYLLTDKGLELWPALHALQRWGDKHTAGSAGPPVVLEHVACGGTVDDHATCEQCHARLSARDVRAHPGPGAGADHPLRRRAQHSAETITARR